MEFAQSKGNARRDGSTGVSFADVGGLQPVMTEMMEVVEVRRRGAGWRWQGGWLGGALLCCAAVLLLLLHLAPCQCDQRRPCSHISIPTPSAATSTRVAHTQFLKDPKQFSALDAKPPKGILLEGDPGVGKTLVAKARRPARRSAAGLPGVPVPSSQASVPPAPTPAPCPTTCLPAAGHRGPGGRALLPDGGL